MAAFVPNHWANGPPAVSMGGPGAAPPRRLESRSLDLAAVLEVAKQVRPRLAQYSPSKGKARRGAGRGIVTLQKPDAASKIGGIYFNVFLFDGTVGIVFDHPREGLYQSFCFDVTIVGLRTILENPRGVAGMCRDRDRPAETVASLAAWPDLVIGDRVRVECLVPMLYQPKVATLVELGQHNDGRAKVLFDNGQSFHCHPSQLTRIDLRPLAPAPKPPKKGCQPLKAELKLQLSRINRELQFIHQDKDQIKQRLWEIEQAESIQQEQARWDTTNESPTSVAYFGASQANGPVPFRDSQHSSPQDVADTHIESVLQFSGAFVQASSPPAPPSTDELVRDMSSLHFW